MGTQIWSPKVSYSRQNQQASLRGVPGSGERGWVKVGSRGNGKDRGRRGVELSYQTQFCVGSQQHLLHTQGRHLGPQPSTPSPLSSRTRTFCTDGSSRPRWQKMGIFLGSHYTYFIVLSPLSWYGERSSGTFASGVWACLNLFPIAASALGIC